MKTPPAPVAAQALAPVPAQGPASASAKSQASVSPQGQASASVQASAPEPHRPSALRPSLQPPVQVALENPFLSPNLMGGEEQRLEQTPPSELQQLIAATPRVNGALVMRDVIVLDGLRFAADGKVIALAGITSVPAGSECRRLDGVVESCIVRAASRLEVLTKGRPVTCDVKEADGRFRGVCRAGNIDLAEDLVRSGLAVRTTDRR
jgi:endonuclease YncB( thermonuclease family)